MRSIIVLGASSWIGHYLIPSLIKKFPHHKIVGSYRSRKPLHDIELFHASNSDLDIIIQKFEGYRPEIIFNLARGEDEEGFQLHKQIIKFTKSSSCHYCYFSSFNAVDSNLETDHNEDEAPQAHSEYGKFKAKCERELIDNGKNYCIYRFSATHGFAPNRKSRTEIFLDKLKTGEKVIVDVGISQNRTSVGQLSEMMVEVAYHRGQGIFNLGTTRPSEEITFLRRLAESFGYSADLIVEGKENKCNAFMVPQKIYDLCGDFLKVTEDEAIREIRAMSDLSIYVKH